MDDLRRLDHRRLERVARWLPELRAWRNARVAPITPWRFTGDDGVERDLALGDAWPRVDTPVRLNATTTVPESWAGHPVEIELWLGGEGFVTFEPGYAGGLNPFHHDFPLLDAATGGETIAIHAEVVPKGMFGTHNAAPAVDRAVLCIPHAQVRELETDLRMLIQTARQLKDHEILPMLLDLVDDAWREVVPHWPSATDIANVRYISGDADGGNTQSVGLGDHGEPGFRGSLLLHTIWHTDPPRGTLEPLPREALDACDRARTVIAAGLDRLRAQYPPIGNLTLTGHAHIDLAWLWPVAETRRKVRRTWWSMLALMDRHEDFTFNQSSAQAYRWMEQDDPALLERVKARVAEGRWETVGGSWTEPDGQVSGGEAYARQLFYGQRYFQQTFGKRHSVAWLPDVFGFSGGIPQLLRLAGLTGFFTIKLNWNEDNPFPHDLFRWQGIDGSSVLAHSFDNPNGGYNGHIEPEDTLTTWRNFMGKRHHDHSLLAFGWGDGGGGPSEDMLHHYTRIRDYPVLPRLEMGTIAAFYDALPREGLPTWTGEMYLELHRATLTTQALVKQLNRQAEHRMVEAEAFAAIASLDAMQYPHERLDAAWEDLLYNQFHDVLPGSSIKEVYRDSHPQMRAVVAEAVALRDAALGALTGEGDDGFSIANPDLNARTLTAILPEDADAGVLPSQPIEGGVLVHDSGVTLGGFASTVVKPGDAAAPAGHEGETETVRATTDGDVTVIENGALRVEIGPDGTLHRVRDLRVDRDVLAERGNQLWAYSDRPRAWDAWDIDETYPDAGVEITAVDRIEVIETGPLRAAVRVTRSWRSSSFVQTYRLLAGSSRIDIATEIDWHERLVLIRALFPTTVHAHEATFETMFGVQRRATHTNTSFERARFEVSAHRFVDLSEPHYGVALLNDSKYGHSAEGGTLGVSLVRGPFMPDPTADEGHHAFTYSLFPHMGNWVDGGVTREAKALNAPLVVTPAGVDAEGRGPFVASTGAEVGFGALKRAHDRDGLVMRLYEPHGDHGHVELIFATAPKSVEWVDLLEEPLDGPEVTLTGATVSLPILPFQVVSLLLTF